MKEKEKTIKRCLTTVDAGLHIRENGSEEGGSRIIAGYAILFGTESEPLWSDEDSEARETIDKGAVTEEFLNGQDIKMTMFHDGHLILARSNKGAGTLTYKVDDKGVSFEFEAPRTVDGDKALELVKRGDISGCSFAFSTRYWDTDFVERTTTNVNGRSKVVYNVKTITGIYDFTLTPDPAYTDTSVETRELAEALRSRIEKKPDTDPGKQKRIEEQLREMRNAATRKIS